MGAVSLGSNIFIVLALFGGGLLMGLDTLVSQAFGAGHREDCHRSLINSIYLSIALTPILAAPVWLPPRVLARMHIDPAIMALAIPYTKALAVGLFPLLLYFAVRLPAGHEHGPHRRLRAHHRQHHQRRRQLGPDLR